MARKKSGASFSYESKYTLQSWDLGLYFPGKEKLIRLVKKENGQYDVLKHGSFPAKYKKELQKLLSFLEKAKTGKLSCHIKAQNQFYEGSCSGTPVVGKLGHSFQARLSQNPLVYLKVSGLSDFFFKKISLSIGKSSLYSNAEFQLDLYVDQCSKLKLEK